MGHYILSFTVYTLAMSGLIFFALFIYKKVMGGNIGKNKTKQLSIEETMPINPRKSIMIVKAGEERFLIASDVDKTSLIAKLDNKSVKSEKPLQEKTTSQTMSGIDLEEINNKINSQNLNVLYPGKSKYLSKDSEKKPQIPKSQKTDKTVHLEVITNRNPQIAGLNRHHPSSSSQSVNKYEEITVDETKNHGLSTIKELVHKVNEM